MGWKAVAVSVSDVASMGARPSLLMLAVSVRSDGDEAFVEGLAQGVGEAADTWGLTLIGGDTTRASGARTITSVVAGPCVGRPIVRSGGRPGDRIWVTGTPGLAGVGWSTTSPSPEALAALRRPRPRVAFALELARLELATAGMDLSDGIASDLPRLCAASGCGAEVDPGSLPSHDGVTLRHQVHGGDDYELMFTANAERSDAIAELAKQLDTPVACVGRMVAGVGAHLRGQDWPEPLFAHFDASPGDATCA